MDYGFGKGGMSSTTTSKKRDYGFGSTLKRVAQEAVVEEEQKKTPVPSSLFTPATVTEEGLTAPKVDFTSGKKPLKSGNDTLNLIVDKLDWIGPALDSLVNVPSEAVTQFVNALSDFTSLPKETKMATKVAKGLSTGVSALNLIPGWLAFGTGLQMAKEIPIIGLPAVGAEKLLQGAGGIASKVAEKGIEKMPFISEESKAELQKPFQELAAVGAQMLIAHGAVKGSVKGIETIKSVSKELSGKLDTEISNLTRTVNNQGVLITPKIAKVIADSAIRKIKQEGKTPPPTVEPQKVPVKRPSDIFRSKSEEILGEIKDTPVGDNVPTVFVRERIAKNDVPSRFRNEVKRILDERDDAQGNRAVMTKTEFESLVRERLMPEVPKTKVTPIAAPAAVEGVATGAKPAPIVETVAGVRTVETPKAVETPIEAVPVQPEAPAGVETKPSKPSVELMEKAVEQAIVKEKFELPETETLNMEENAKIVKRTMTEKPNEAYEIAMGRRDAPVGSRSSTFWKAMSDYAMRTRNQEMVMDLATNSKVPKLGTEAGREIKGFDYGEGAPSAVETIVKLNKTREAQAKKTYGDKAEKKIKEVEKKSMDKEIGETKMKPKDWDSFMESLICK